MTSEDRVEEEEREDLFEHFKYNVDPGQELLRIDKFLFDRIKNVSRNRIQVATKNGNVLVNGNQVKPNYKVRYGDEISVILPYPPKETEVLPEDLPLEIVYEDQEVIVLNKAAGMVVHPGFGNHDGTLVNALLHHFGELPSSEGQRRPGLVHRLDKDTSGLMVVAKTEHALTHLAKQFFDRTTDRKYWALAWGDVEEEGTVEGNIGRSLKNRKVQEVFPEGDFGKVAITHYKPLERLGYVTLVECKLDTGRTHQIRVHMKHIGHSLFNDADYDGDRIRKGTVFTKYKQFVQNAFELCPRQALHAKTLAFTHPTSGERMEFSSELPEDIAQLLEKWRAYIGTRKD